MKIKSKGLSSLDARLLILENSSESAQRFCWVETALNLRLPCVTNNDFHVLDSILLECIQSDLRIVWIKLQCGDMAIGSNGMGPAQARKSNKTANLQNYFWSAAIKETYKEDYELWPRLWTAARNYISNKRTPYAKSPWEMKIEPNDKEDLLLLAATAFAIQIWYWACSGDIIISGCSWFFVAQAWWSRICSGTLVECL